MNYKKLIKSNCEIFDCNINDKDLLHYHHIIPRSNFDCTNDSSNIAILCANHHELLHSNKLIILGVINSTRPPNKRTLVYKINDVCNMPELENYNFNYLSVNKMDIRKR